MKIDPRRPHANHDCKITTASLAAQLFRIRGAYKKARFPRPAASGILSPRPRVIIRFRELPVDSSKQPFEVPRHREPFWASLKSRDFSINAPCSSIWIVF